MKLEKRLHFLFFLVALLPTVAIVGIYLNAKALFFTHLGAAWDESELSATIENLRTVTIFSILSTLILGSLAAFISSRAIHRSINKK